MYKIILFIVFAASMLNCSGQSPLNCRFCDSLHITTFPRDLNKLYQYIDGLRTHTLIPFKELFDACHRAGNSQSLNRRLDSMVDSTVSAVQANIDSIKNDPLYIHKPPTDTTCLLYYTNKELNDYIASLQSITGLVKTLLDTNQKVLVLNEFNNINFLSSYYSMFESRSLLLSAMDNLEHFLALKDTLGIQTRWIAGKVDSGRREVSAEISTVRKQVDSVLPTQLNNMQVGIQENTRKNSMIWGIAGGLIAGLVSGLIVHSLK